MGASHEKWPLSKFFFQVNINGTTISFQACDGLEASTSVMEFRDGNSQKFYKQKRATLTSYSNVTLKKGMFEGDLFMHNWHKGIADGGAFGDMRTVTITLAELQGSDSKAMFTWTLEKAFVVKYVPSGLDSTADSEPAIEEMELAYQSFTMESGGSISLSGLAGLVSSLTGGFSLSGSIGI